MFRAAFLPIIRSSILLLVANGSSQLHKIYQSWCTAKISWWWPERLPETCRVVTTIKMEFSTSIGFIHKDATTWSLISLKLHTYIVKSKDGLTGILCAWSLFQFGRSSSSDFQQNRPVFLTLSYYFYNIHSQTRSRFLVPYFLRCCLVCAAVQCGMLLSLVLLPVCPFPGRPHCLGDSHQFFISRGTCSSHRDKSNSKMLKKIPSW
jgi:hypothetical protein